MGKRDLDSLVRETVAGDSGAFRELQNALAPHISAIAGSHESLRARDLHTSEDDVAEILAASLERLSRDDFKNLKRYLSQREENSANPQSFDSWLYGAVDFTIREHLRARYGRAPSLAPESNQAPKPSKRDLASHAGRLESEEFDRSFIQTLSMTSKLTVQAIFAYIQRDFSESETRALRMYYSEDRDFDEIARELGLADAKSADKLIRKLNARLRYHFGETG